MANERVEPVRVEATGETVAVDMSGDGAFDQKADLVRMRGGDGRKTGKECGQGWDLLHSPATPWCSVLAAALSSSIWIRAWTAHPSRMSGISSG